MEIVDTEKWYMMRRNGEGSRSGKYKREWKIDIIDMCVKCKWDNNVIKINMQNWSALLFLLGNFFQFQFSRITSKKIPIKMFASLSFSLFAVLFYYYTTANSNPRLTRAESEPWTQNSWWFFSKNKIAFGFQSNLVRPNFQETFQEILFQWLPQCGCLGWGLGKPLNFIQNSFRLSFDRLFLDCIGKDI